MDIYFIYLIDNYVLKSKYKIFIEFVMLFTFPRCAG